MSLAPHSVHGFRFGVKLGEDPVVSTLQQDTELLRAKVHFGKQKI